MPRKPAASELHTDLKDISTRIAGVKRNGATSESARIAEDILVERKRRLQKQNVKLDHEIARAEQQFVDFNLIKGQVLRANEVVKQSLFAMVVRVAEQLAAMDNPAAIQQFLHAALVECFNDLAFTHGCQDLSEG